jgi:RNA polymerase sigma-70 factor (ECF subfamily)
MALLSAVASPAALRLPLRPGAGILAVMDRVDGEEDGKGKAQEPAAQAAADAAAVRAAGWLSRFAAGDDAAFAALVGEYQPLALAVAARVIGGRSEVVEDVVQEAFLRVLRHQGRFDPARPFRAWFLAIVRNLAIDALRRRRPLAGEGAAAELADHSSSAGSAGLERAELRRRVAEILAGLPEKYRILLVMREMEGRPAEDIAAEQGLDYGTARWRLHQARALFRAAWVRRFGEEEP